MIHLTYSIKNTNTRPSSSGPRIPSLPRLPCHHSFPSPLPPSTTVPPFFPVPLPPSTTVPPFFPVPPPSLDYRATILSRPPPSLDYRATILSRPPSLPRLPCHHSFPSPLPPSTTVPPFFPVPPPSLYYRATILSPVSLCTVKPSILVPRIREYRDPINIPPFCFPPRGTIGVLLYFLIVIWPCHVI